jgi:hypothetical protein
MQLSGPQKWAQAKMNAEMMNYLKEEKWIAKIAVAEQM